MNFNRILYAFALVGPSVEIPLNPPEKPRAEGNYLNHGNCWVVLLGPQSSVCYVWDCRVSRPYVVHPVQFAALSATPESLDL